MIPPLVAGAAVALLWTYLGFPVTVLLRARLRPDPLRPDPVPTAAHRPAAAHSSAEARCSAGTPAPSSAPSVAVVIAAHNEQGTIGAKLANVLAGGYPAELLDVVVAADGCTDGTQQEVAAFAARGVRLLDLPRAGKAAALNAAVAACRGDVVVFTDANSILAPDALTNLVRPFEDERVGGVAGDQRYLRGDDGATDADGERAYWSLDRMVKNAESRAGSVISATGALYAIRRELVPVVVDGVTDDFWVSTNVIACGRRLVFAPDAAVYEDVAGSDADEYNRKVRIITRGLRGVYLRRELLDPRRHGFYAVQLASHKVLRRLMFVPLLALLAGTLTRRERVYRAATLAQLTLYGLGGAGLALRRRGVRSRPLSIPAYFVMVNSASAQASANVLRGKRIDRWTPTRSGQ